MSSELVPIRYEYDEEAASEVAALLKGSGVKVTVAARRGSYAVLAPAARADEAMAKIGGSRVDEDHRVRWRAVARKAVVAIPLILVVALLARTVWGIAALWIVFVVGGVASAALYGRDVSEPRYRGD